MTACSLCRQIPRVVRASSTHSILDCVRHLGPFEESGWRECPECKSRYFVSYEATYEDMSFWEEIEVTRDVSALAVPELLNHPEQYIRTDAAFALARAGRPELSWVHSDPMVRRSGLSALEPPLDVRFLLQDEDPTVRQVAGRLTISWLLEKHDSLGMAELLQGLPDVRLMAAGYLRHSEGLDPVLLAPLLQDSLTGWEWLASQDYQVDRQIGRLLAASQDPDPEQRKKAVSALDSVRGHWGAQTAAVLEGLRKLLESDGHSRLWVLNCLRNLGGELDLRPFLPRLAELLATENAYHFQEVGPLLGKRVRLGEGDSSLVIALMPGLTFSNTYQRRLVGDCYRALMEAGVPLGPAQDLLVRVMSADKTEYCEDMLVPAVTTYLVRRAAWPELERLLRGGASVAGHVALILSKQRFDYKPLEPVLNELLESPSEWVSENCLKALVR